MTWILIKFKYSQIAGRYVGLRKKKSSLSKRAATHTGLYKLPAALLHNMDKYEGKHDIYILR